MKISSNVTDKILRTVFSKFAEEKAFMLNCTISSKANWYFGSDYISVASKLLQKVIQVVLTQIKKLCIVQNLNYSNFVSISSWDQGQIGIKLGKKHVIY